MTTVKSSETIRKYLLSKADEIEKVASDLENLFSIIFDSEGNFFFAGDARKRIVKKTLKKADSTYQIIKVPHHGTKGYYVDFAKYSISEKTILLIPNSL